MTDTKKDRPKGAGRKGGTRFPNYSLKQVLPHLKDFISKTHTKPITIEQMNAGVFKVKSHSADGKVKFSSLRQYGFASGEYHEIKPMALATKMEMADEKEKVKLLREAVMNVPTFRNTFETFQGSAINKAKIKAYSVSTLKIHPDVADKFVFAFIESAELAKLCSINNEEISFINAKDIEDVTKSPEDDVNGKEDLNEGEDDEFTEDDDQEHGDDSFTENNNSKNKNQSNRYRSGAPSIELKIDPTLDPDKLEKQLKILKKFGLI